MSTIVFIDRHWLIYFVVLVFSELYMAGVAESNSIYSLKLLVKLTEEYCLKYRVKLEPKKTKLLGYCDKKTELLVKLAASSKLITINEIAVEFTHEAEHVGVLRTH